MSSIHLSLLLADSLLADMCSVFSFMHCHGHMSEAAQHMFTKYISGSIGACSKFCGTCFHLRIYRVCGSVNKWQDPICGCAKGTSLFVYAVQMGWMRIWDASSWQLPSCAVAFIVPNQHSRAFPMDQDITSVFM